MKTVAQILGNRKGKIVKVRPSESVSHALRVMAEHNVGAVLVMEQDRLMGIMTERDYARKVALKGRSGDITRVDAIMSERVVSASMNMTLESAMSLTSECNIRHLPVVDNRDAVVGVISVRDIIRELLAEQRFVIEQLEQYIAA